MVVFAPNPLSKARIPVPEKLLLSKTTVSMVVLVAREAPKALAKSSSSSSLTILTVLTVVLAPKAAPALVRSVAFKPRNFRFPVRSTTTTLVLLILLEGLVPLLSLVQQMVLPPDEVAAVVAAMVSKYCSISLRFRAARVPALDACLRRAWRSLSTLNRTVLSICCLGMPARTCNPTTTRLVLFRTMASPRSSSAAVPSSAHAFCC
mmetsp:Transcript_22659/g.49290  ORF Transcript_22659/g.49290 Transcript_22659/m.49290 type:complete len:206 (-) Transcript_22659:204-821(-)